MEYAKDELQSAMDRDDETVVFIVGMCFCLSTAGPIMWCFPTAYVFGSTSIGQGRHSVDGVSKLRPALETLFDEYVVGDFHTMLFSIYSHTRLDAD